MRKKVDLSKEIVKNTKITRNLKTYTTHSFNYTNFINGVTTESEETDENQEVTENLEDLNEQEDNDDTANDATEENNDNQDDTENSNENYNNESNLNKNLSKAKDIKNKLDKFKKTEKKAKDAKKAVAILKNPLTIKILLAILVIAVVVVGIVLLIAIVTNITGSGSLSFGGYYDAKCSEMTVIFVDSSNGYEVTGSQTYSMEDYVAGVVSAEVGGFANKEVYKVYALAARTFGLTASSDDCTIEGSARRQAFRDISESSGTTVDMIYEAVRETEGQVLLSNGELYKLQYDAFCYIDKDANYYTLSQKNQKIPVDWAESTVWSKYYLNCPCDLKDESMTECWKNGVWQDGGHGRGMSQYGAYYLATEQGYTYDEILDYYYGDAGVTISSNSFMSSIAGLEIKDTTKATSLNQPITDFLSSKGSSLDDMNSYIHNSVVDAGVGTREGVVTAAVSMINYLYDNFNTKLPYYWGGKAYGLGIPSSFGRQQLSSASTGGNVYSTRSFDCSGFVSWAIKNGGYNFGGASTAGFASQFYKNSCDITDSDCIGQPGDLINYRNSANTAGHVLLILAVDQENEKYFVAHSGGNEGVVMEQRNMHSKEVNDGLTKIVFMEEYYSDSSNINNNY